MGNLLGQSFLNLQAASKHINNSRYFTEAEYFVAREISHVRLAEEGQHMVLAEAEELDIFDDHHLVILDLEDGAVKEFVNVGMITAGQKTESLAHTFGRTHQSLTSRVFTEAGQDFGNMRRDRRGLAFRCHYLYCGFRFHRIVVAQISKMLRSVS